MKKFNILMAVGYILVTCLYVAITCIYAYEGNLTLTILYAIITTIWGLLAGEWLYICIKNKNEERFKE